MKRGKRKGGEGKGRGKGRQREGKGTKGRRKGKKGKERGGKGKEEFCTVVIFQGKTLIQVIWDVMQQKVDKGVSYTSVAH